LIALLQEGTRQSAQRELVIRHLPFTRRFVIKHARRVGLAPSYVADAQQEAALALLEAIGRYNPQNYPPEHRCSFHTFLNVVLRARFSDFVKLVWRAERHRQHCCASGKILNGQQAYKVALADLANWEDPRQSDPALAVEKQEQMERVAELLQDLTSSKRFLWERLAAGVKLPMAARQLGISYAAARRRLRKTIRFIASAMEERRST
jgi:RNA polymerase sigma factor (sigma-70 family)